MGGTAEGNSNLAILGERTMPRKKAHALENRKKVEKPRTLTRIT